MRIAIITISTNNYNSLLEDLIKSIDLNFLTSYKKDIYIFSDCDLFPDRQDIFINKITHEKWPFITLKRFSFFNSIKNELEKYDKIIYLDSDMVINSCIDELPNNDYFCVIHPANIFNVNFWSTEKNPKSTAYCPVKKKHPYVQGCFWGGDTQKILKMFKILDDNIQKDLTNDIIAIWHDESHLNKFLEHINHEDIHFFNPGYAYPEKMNINFPKKIIHRDKNRTEYPRFGGSKK